MNQPVQRVSGTALGHAGGDDRAEGAEGAGRELLPEPAGLEEARRGAASPSPAAERALVAVVQEAYLQGVSTHRQSSLPGAEDGGPGGGGDRRVGVCPARSGERQRAVEAGSGELLGLRGFLS